MRDGGFLYDIFISYSSKDRRRVRRLAARLRDDGQRVWFDEWSVLPGDFISLKIERGLEQSNALVLCMSEHMFASSWAIYERHIALFRDPCNDQRRIIPLRLDDAEIPPSLKIFRYVDWRRESDEQYALLLQALPSTSQAPESSGKSAGAYPDLEACLRRRDLSLHRVDGYLEICRSPGWRGWTRSQVRFEHAGDYKPFEQFEEVLKRHRTDGGSKPRYGLHAICNMPLMDDHSPLRLQVFDGWYHFVDALTQESALGANDPSPFRASMEDLFWPIERSPFWHNINAQVGLITGDSRIVLMKRSPDVRIYPGRWSVGIEEQMQRTVPNVPGDTDIFACAERGVDEELGLQLHSYSTLLVGIGMEWLNFSASFIFIGRVVSTSSEIKRLWMERAKDRYEGVALDFIPATPGSVRSALAAAEWSPSSQAISCLGSGADLRGAWHPTARARLLSYLRHVENTE
ncbi:MAG: toll/interleukin-1 receptor domain-containing protein [Polyangiaceae bacterium]|nr:toll/interleukin-1 receptor domain-containing protein [Polyangiaceae bacterium]